MRVADRAADAISGRGSGMTPTDEMLRTIISARSITEDMDLSPGMGWGSF